MKQEKNCIFHIPVDVEKKGTSGSSIRPYKMIEAFKDNGYNVDIIMGYGKERKQQIGRIKEKVKQGTRYDFLYSENCNIPTLLTEKNHIPKYPFLDFGFMKFCRKNGIKVGLFYRDVYWRFPIYKQEVSIFKRCISIPLFNYDIKKYKELVNVFYLPSMEMRKYIDLGDKIPHVSLPPGCEDYLKYCDKKERGSNEELRLFYVGGVGKLYDLTKLLKVVQKLPFVKLVICCRENEWNSRQEAYSKYLCDRVEIVHKSGEELKKYYNWCDICMLFFANDGYRDFAMPVKLFEYMSHVRPIIATSHTVAGDFVEDSKVGWKIDHKEQVLENLLTELYNEPAKYNEMSGFAENAVKSNLWAARAKEVINNLSI